MTVNILDNERHPLAQELREVVHDITDFLQRTCARQEDSINVRIRLHWPPCAALAGRELSSARCRAGAGAGDRGP